MKGSATAQADVTAAAPAEASIEWIRDFEQRFQDARNSHQADRVLVLMTEDIEYRDALAEDDARSRGRLRVPRRGLEGVPRPDLLMIEGP